MNKSFSLLFYLKKTKMNAEGLVPVYLRITIDSSRVEISSKRYINPVRKCANNSTVKYLKNFKKIILPSPFAINSRALKIHGISVHYLVGILFQVIFRFIVTILLFKIS